MYARGTPWAKSGSQGGGLNLVPRLGGLNLVPGLVERCLPQNLKGKKIKFARGTQPLLLSSFDGAVCKSKPSMEK